MRSSFATRSRVPLGGVPLARTPSHRQQAARRRWIMAGGVVALALASGVIGAMTAGRSPPNGSVETGPFSYFPYQ